MAQTTEYLVLDTESIPDGRLLSLVKYPDDDLSPADAVARAQAAAVASSGSDFLPVTFQIPVAACVLQVGADFAPQRLECLDAHHYRPRVIVEAFWAELDGLRLQKGKLVTFNGKGFDLPLLEMAAFRYGISAKDHFGAQSRRGEGWHLDLMDWLTNSGVNRLSGGLNLLAKLLGKPGKMEVRGNLVYPLFLQGRLRDINDYCLYDTLDTYFVFLRTRVLTGELTLDEETALVGRAKSWLAEQASEFPAIHHYLANWGDWNPWP